MFFFKCSCQNCVPSRKWKSFCFCCYFRELFSIEYRCFFFFWNISKNYSAIRFSTLAPQKKNNAILSFPVPSRWPNRLCDILRFSNKLNMPEVRFRSASSNSKSMKSSSMHLTFPEWQLAFWWRQRLPGRPFPYCGEMNSGKVIPLLGPGTITSSEGNKSPPLLGIIKNQ